MKWLLILSLISSQTRASDLADKYSVFIHSVDMTEADFQKTVGDLHGIDFTAWLHHQTSLQDLDSLQIDENGKSVKLALEQMLKFPMLPSDIAVALDLYNKISEKDLNPSLRALAQSWRNLGLEPQNPRNSTPENPTAPESLCSDEFLVDGSWFSRPREGVHQWNFFSNCSLPLTWVGTYSEFKEVMSKQARLGKDSHNDFSFARHKIQVLTSAENTMAESPANMTSTSNGTGLTSRQKTWLWVGAIALGVIGFTAYQLRDKDVSFNMGGLSF